VSKLQDLHDQLTSDDRSSSKQLEKPGFFKTLFTRGANSNAATDTIAGLYLWGGVGRGKTLLCDMFYEGLPFNSKKRMHFHRFMRGVHQQLAEIKHTASPLEVVAAKFAANNRVLVLDEMHVNDITDAMIMGGLLDGLFSHGVTVVTTSNALPDDLYRDGLQRSRFLPAIEMIKQYTEVVFLGGDIDYRKRILENAAIYHYPHNESSTKALESHFHQLIASCSFAENAAVVVNDREIESVVVADGVVWFTFMNLCETTRSTDDYIEIGRLFHTVLISEVPQMNSKTNDAARRFINMVDEFYDRKVKVVISAAVLPEDLYEGARLKFEFERTASRLREMQSHDYLGTPHLP